MDSNGKKDDGPNVFLDARSNDAKRMVVNRTWFRGFMCCHAGRVSQSFMNEISLLELV